MASRYRGRAETQRSARLLVFGAPGHGQLFIKASEFKVKGLELGLEAWMKLGQWRDRYRKTAQDEALWCTESTISRPAPSLVRILTSHLGVPPAPSNPNRIYPEPLSRALESAEQARLPQVDAQTGRIVIGAQSSSATCRRTPTLRVQG